MEKAQAMRLQACLPQSWWEFALEHATHVYNRTPVRRLNWLTPFESLNGEKPTVDHLRVFGCGAYVYLPEEVRPDKLAPKSELMTYLSNAPGTKGWTFMRGPNNILFTAAQAIFDKELFPKCPLAVRRPTTRLQTPAPPPSTCPKKGPCHCSPPKGQDDDEGASTPKPRRSAPTNGKGKERARDEDSPPPPRKGEDEVSLPSTRPPSPAPVEQPAAGPSRPQRTRSAPNRPGNIYGETRNPVDIERQIRTKKDWSRIVGERPRSSRHQAARDPQPRAPTPQEEQSKDDESSSSDEEESSEEEVRDSLEPP